MANAIPFRTTPQLGPQLDETFTSLPYWDLALPNVSGVEPSYKLGNRESGDDGQAYVWVKASAAIDATASTGTQVTVTSTGTAAAGSGGWYAPVGGVPINAYFHARSKPWNAF
jgi:hypothetical protein